MFRSCDLRLIGEGPAFKKLREFIAKASRYSSTVLIEGESGTGKEVVANLIHQQSSRKTNNFIAVNCSAFPETLLESELFGYSRGAFTGAAHGRTGLIEMADRGTLFLDEIGEMPLSLQPKLLRILQNKVIVRLGSNVPKQVNFRLIVATNQSLLRLVKSGQFREDLFHRLNVLPIRTPPLSENRQDIPNLVQFFSKRMAAEMNCKELVFSPDAISELRQLPLTGNVRELENIVERLYVLANSQTVTSESINQSINGYQLEDANFENIFRQLGTPSFEKLELEYFKYIYKLCNCRSNEAAKLLGVSSKTIHRRLRANAKSASAGLTH